MNLLRLYAKGMRGVADLYGFSEEGFVREVIDAFKPYNRSLVGRLGLVDGELGEWFKNYLLRIRKNSRVNGDVIPLSSPRRIFSWLSGGTRDKAMEHT